MNGGFRVRPDGQFVVNSLNSGMAQKGSHEAGKSNDTSIQASQTNQNASASPLPSISLPKGGGAIRGIGEKFAANPVTGTGSLTVPIFTSPGRSGFGPQLSLSYDSGSGNGPFGFGWSFSLPSITRKTDKGLPKYQDANNSDVFILSGAEDLVPVFKKKPDGNWDYDPESNLKIDDDIRDGFVVRRYRPRIEGLFARIERWTSKNGDVHWRSISKDNILTVYGRDQNSRIVDGSRIFSWLICESYDDKGNAIVYEYEPENEEGIDLSQVSESNRLRTANRYLKRIKYGNRKPLLLDITVPGFRGLHIQQPDFENAGWMFEVVFDYEENKEGHYKELNHDDNSAEHHYIEATTATDGKWSCRPDPFSTYRAGFEVRTYRRCTRVLMFHSFPELGTEPCLVRSTEFDYNDLDYKKKVTIEDELAHKGSTRFASFIRRVIQSGYMYDQDHTFPEPDDSRYRVYLKKSLPPLEFDYSQAVINENVEEIDQESHENMPYGLDGARYQWVDLDGEGVSGILTEQAGAWFYKPNLGNGEFGAMKRVATKPSLASLNGGFSQLLDLAGDGQLDVAELGSDVPGFYERTHDQKWENFIPFSSLPNIPWKDPNLKFVDLTGDGHADVMITEDQVFTWYPSLAEAGFGPSERVRQALDEDKGARLVFDDGTQSIYLADFSGDGLSDLVRIRNGEVCYWPNLGYGRFGAKVTMDNAPWFDRPDLFDQKRIRLADVDGSGVTDIIYLGNDGASIYFNHSGNSWSSARKLVSFPHIDNISSVQVADLFGNGTACIVWSSPLPCDSGRPMLYIDLMGGQKPHLLEKSKNNLGAETIVRYSASTKFYLKDKNEGKPWITNIPFPVHVVERVETHDHISKNRFVTTYAYHHGYFDGIEREFRGFGMVEQWDTEEFDVPSEDDEFSSANNFNEVSYVPPVRTKTWFHTGAYLRGEEISRQLAYEYFGAPDPDSPEFETFLETLLDDTVPPSVPITADEMREACRSLKGSILRQEIYALDGSPKAGIPYSVSERNYNMELLQPRGSNQHAVFFTHANETINYHYERNIQDPRIQHELVLEVDDFGNVLQSAAIGYGRLQSDLPDPDGQKQTTTLITYTQNDVTEPVDDEDAYRAPVVWQASTYQLTGYKQIARADRFTQDDFGKWQDNRFILDFDGEIQYEEEHANGKQKRLIEHARTKYRSNSLDILLPWGTMESLALPGETYKLAFTPGLISTVYQRKHENRPSEELISDPSTVLGGTGSDRGGYVDLDGDGYWWIPSGRVFYDPNSDENDPSTTAAAELAEACAHFFLPRKFTDPFGHSSTVEYDQPHNLLIVRAEDAVKNVIRADNDYRVLQPALVIDPNENRSQVIFDALGMVAGTAVMGKENEPDGRKKGDSLDGFEPDLTQAKVDEFMKRPREPAANNTEGRATQIVHDLLGKATSRIIYDLDRFGRRGEPPFAATIARETHDSDLLQGQRSKLQVSFSYSDGFGREIQKKIQAEPGPLVEGGATVNPRWVGSGWTIFNNKGKPVRKYEPFFSATHGFEFEKINGVSSVLFYDPVERVVATLHPNNTYEKVVFDPWHQKSYDVNDTVTFNPKGDKDIQGFVAKHFATLPDTWQTWYNERIGGALGVEEQKAAQKTQLHADTPTVTYFDTLGRPFLTIAHNKFERDGTIIEEKYQTRVNLDIEGNRCDVKDTKDRIVMKYDYDMLSNQIHQASMEAGERWVLNDVTGKPIRAWDSRGHNFWTEYDELRRPVLQFIRGTDAGHSDPRTLNTDIVIAKTEYGEGRTNDKQLNMRTRIYQISDSAGVVTSQLYDFKGNLLSSRRQLAADYKNLPDWSLATLKQEFTSRTVYDALNRPVTLTTPDNSVIRPTYNEANFLEKMEVNLRGASTPTTFISNIDYNARGQRVLIEYGNGIIEYGKGVQTTYEYDKKTFRLTHLKTMRGTEPMQYLFYTYDPAGNITTIRDDAQEIIYHNGEAVIPEAEYTYDAIYRLIRATGREHIGQVSVPYTTWDDAGRVGLAHPEDLQKMRNYRECYFYDEVGNIKRFDHKANSGNWIREYEYNEESLIEQSKKNNRLSYTVVHPDSRQPITEPYTYDLHGNTTCMPHLPQMAWDFNDQLQMVDKGGGCKAYYVYDAAGQRVRKVMEDNGTRMNERIYLGGFEIYRKYSNGSTLERETLHVMDDKQRIALVETRTQGDDGSPPQVVRYQLSNHLGSASLELDENAQVISYEEYYPYGSTSYQAGRSAVEVSLKRYRYTGKERDEETGLYYHGARYYAPWLGRWTSCDPAGLVDGENMFVYVKANPVLLTDPTGRQTPGLESWFYGKMVRESRHPEEVIEGIQKGHEAVAAVGATIALASAIPAEAWLVAMFIAFTQVKSSDDWEGHARLATLGAGYLSSSYSLRAIHREWNANWEWSLARERLRERLAAAGDPLVPYEPVHHAVIPQGGKGQLTLRGFFGEQWGRLVPNYIKNRSWNLIRPPADTRMMGWQNMQAWHTMIHGGAMRVEEGAFRLSLPERLWHGSPPWLKWSAVGYVGITSATVGATAILGEMRTEERESKPGLELVTTGGKTDDLVQERESNQGNEPATSTGGKTDDLVQRMRWNIFSGGNFNFTRSTKQLDLKLNSSF